MHPQNMHNKRIAIWGMGKEGRSVFKRLQNEPLANLLCVDDNCDDKNFIDSNGLKESITKNDIDIIIKSPGISLYNPIVELAKEKCVVVTSATNMWFAENVDSKIILVTGTKGKSTTSKLIYFLLKKAEIDVALGGNLGIPLYELYSGHSLYIIEMSSYQLADFNGYADVVLFLNLFPEHAPWHLTHEQYNKDKTSALSRAKDTVISSKEILENYKHLVNLKAMAICYDELKEFYVKDGELFYDNSIITPKDFPLKGQHNLWNLAAVCTTLSVFNINPTKYLDQLKDFVPLPHRLQEVIKSEGILYVNDSISTAPQSTVQAVNTYSSKNISLILGGADRMQDYVWLAKELTPHQNQIKAIFTIPDNGNRICQEFQKANYPGSIRFVPDLETAVQKSREALVNGGVILLSPAAPRSKRFENLEARGSLFSELASKNDENSV